MQKLLISTILFLLMGLLGCNKDNASQGDCQINNFGYIDFWNNSDDPYTVYIDKREGFTLVGKQGRDDYQTSAGSHTIKVIQENGSSNQATKKTYYISVPKCEKANCYFPQNAIIN